MTALPVVALLSILWSSTAPRPGAIVKHGRNAIADALARDGLSLGIDFDAENPKAPHPTKERVQELATAGFVGWLNGEVERGDDSISPPTSAIRDYLESHRQTIDGLISALEKGPPEWEKGDADEQAASEVSVRLLPAMLLFKILVAASLSAEREGLEIEAERALEASWSLARSVTESGTLVSQLIFIAMDRWQSGTLRKFKSAPLPWMGRLETGDPYQRVFESIDPDRWENPSGLSDPDDEALRKAMRSALASIRKMSPCELATMTNDEISELGRRGLPAGGASQQIVDIQVGISMPNLVSAIRRAGRLSVDRELTVKILRLKLERERSKEKRWPEALTDSTSAACPGAEYSYRVDGEGMEIRFEGDIPAPEGSRALPLSYRTGGAQTSATPSPRPVPSPTPEAP